MIKFTLAATDLFENVSAIISIHHFPSGRHRLRFLRNTVRYGFGMKLKMNYVQTCFSVHIKKRTLRCIFTALSFYTVRIHEKFYHRVTFTSRTLRKKNHSAAFPIHPFQVQASISSMKKQQHFQRSFNIKTGYSYVNYNVT